MTPRSLTALHLGAAVLVGNPVSAAAHRRRAAQLLARDAHRALTAGDRVAALRTVCVAMAGELPDNAVEELVGVLDAIQGRRT